jgi:HPr kinase/phosphorylase
VVRERAPRRAEPAPAPEEERPEVQVSDLLSRAAAHLRLRLLAGRPGLGHRILQARVQRPGLALTGYVRYLSYGRVQIVGASEIGYLATLGARARTSSIARLGGKPLSCFVVTKGQQVPGELLREAQRRRIPLLATPLDTTTFIKQLGAYLDERLAPRVHLHGVLLDVFGLGVLIVGESGIGKSECALDLIDRGHRLVADDVVEVRRLSDALVGASPPLTRYHMELRGLGVINLRDLYGISAMRMTKRVELVVQMERWEAGHDYDRLGLGREKYRILGVEAPLVRLPVAPGRNTAMLVEVASRNQLLRERGYDAARRFARRVDSLVVGRPPARPPRRARARR